MFMDKSQKKAQTQNLNFLFIDYFRFSVMYWWVFVDQTRAARARSAPREASRGSRSSARGARLIQGICSIAINLSSMGFNC